MSTQNDTVGNDEDENLPDELTLLKKRADTLNISYHPSIGVDSLKKKIAAALSDEPDTSAKEDETSAEEAPVENRAQKRRRIGQEARKLIRLRITNLNPNKKDLHGEIFTVANEFVGIVKRFIPYGETTDEGYHVENILYKQMKARKFLQVKTRKDPKNPGNMLVDTKWVNEFALEVLDPLTKEELEELARVQAASGSLK